MWVVWLLVKVEAFVQLVDSEIAAVLNGPDNLLEFPFSGDELFQCSYSPSYTVSTWVKFDAMPNTSQVFISLSNDATPFLTATKHNDGSIEAAVLPLCGSPVSVTLPDPQPPSWVFVVVSACSEATPTLTLALRSWASASYSSDSVVVSTAFTESDVDHSVLSLGGIQANTIIVSLTQSQIVDAQFECLQCSELSTVLLRANRACYAQCSGNCIGPGDKACPDYIQVAHERMQTAFSRSSEIVWTPTDLYFRDYSFMHVDFSFSGWFLDTENVEPWRILFIAENTPGGCCGAGTRVLAMFRHNTLDLYPRCDSPTRPDNGPGFMPLAVWTTQVSVVGAWTFVGMSVCSGNMIVCYYVLPSTTQHCSSSVIAEGTNPWGGATAKLRVGGYGSAITGMIADQRFYPHTCMTFSDFDAVFAARNSGCGLHCNSCSTPFDCSSCEVGYYPSSDGNCIACNSCCASCSGPGNTHCDACNPPCILVTANTCVSNGSADCPPTCATCRGRKAWMCHTCRPGFFLHPYNSRLCLSTCPSGYTAALGSCTGSDQIVMDYRLDRITPTISSVNGQSALNGAGLDYFPPAFEGSDPLPAKQRGYFFSGAQYIQLPPGPNTTGSPTIFGTSTTFSLWIRPQGAGVRTVYSKKEGCLDILTIRLSGSNNIEIVGGHPVHAYTHPVALITDQWEFVVITFEFSIASGQTTISIYFDQVLSGTAFACACYLKDESATAAQVIGASTTFTEGFQGFIWRVRAYNYILTDFSSEKFGSGMCPIGETYCLSTFHIDRTPEGQWCPASCNAGCVRPTDCSLCADELCATCVDFVTCSACVNSAVSVPPCQCIGSRFFNSATRTCDSCAAGCIECSAIDTCLKCAANAEMPTGVCVCRVGFFPSPDSSNCQQCGTACFACSSAAACTSCHSNAELAGTECTCSQQYFPASTPRNCQPCDTSCFACSSETECTGCKANASLVGSQCSCNAGYFGAASECKPCGYGCLHCSEVSCQQCYSGLLLFGGLCVSACPQGFEGNAVTGVCEKQAELTALTADLETDPPRSFLLSFSETIKSPLSAELITAEVTDLDGVSVQSALEMSEISPTNLYNLTVTPSNSTAKEYSVTFLLSASISDVHGNKLETKELHGVLNFTELLGTKDQAKVPPHVSSAAAVAEITVATGVINSLLSGSSGPFFSLFNNVQMLAYLPLSTVRIPQYLRGFLSSLNMVSILPNPFLYLAAEDSGPTPPPFAKDFGYTSCLFLLNAGIIASIGMTIAGAAVVTRTLSKCPARLFPHYFRQTAATASSCTQFWIQVYFDACLAGFLQLRAVVPTQASLESGFAGSNCAIAVLTTVLGVATPLLCVWAALRTSRDFHTAAFLTAAFAAFNDKSHFKGAMYYSVFFLHRLLYALTLIFLSAYPWCQSLSFVIGSILVPSTQAVVYSLHCASFRKKLETLSLMCSQLCTSLVFMLTAAYNYDLSESVSGVFEQGCYICVYIAFGLSNVVGAVGSLAVVKKLWRSYMLARRVALSSENPFSSQRQDAFQWKRSSLG